MVASRQTVTRMVISQLTKLTLILLASTVATLLHTTIISAKNIEYRSSGIIVTETSNTKKINQALMNGWIEIYDKKLPKDGTIKSCWTAKDHKNINNVIEENGANNLKVKCSDTISDNWLCTLKDNSIADINSSNISVSVIANCDRPTAEEQINDAAQKAETDKKVSLGNIICAGDAANKTTPDGWLCRYAVDKVYQDCKTAASHTGVSDAELDSNLAKCISESSTLSPFMDDDKKSKLAEALGTVTQSTSDKVNDIIDKQNTEDACKSGNDVTKCSDKNTCEIAGGTWADTGDGKGSCTNSTINEKCAEETGVFSWLMCPGASLLQGAMNKVYDAIDSGLQWTYLTGSTSASIRETWSKFLGIANIAFAIAFLIMIYSMATSTGLSNYDVKKMLPRLIVVAISVNLSFYICAAIVDLSNIAGDSIYKLLQGTLTGDGKNPAALIADVFSLASAMIVAILFLPTVLLGLVLIVACLALRSTVLLVLVIISPLAFVCYLLPNTDKWFKKWLNEFVRLLLVYPMFSLVRGAAALVANVVAQISNGVIDNIYAWLMAAGCAIAPAIALVPIFKMSGSIMGKVTNMTQGAANKTKAKERLNKAYRGSKAFRGANRQFSRGLGALQNKTRGVPVLGGIFSKPSINRAVASSSAAENALDKDAMESANNFISSLDNDKLKKIATTGKYVDKNGKERTADNYVRRAAMSKVGESLGANETADMLKSVATSDDHRLRAAGVAAAKAAGNSFIGGGALSSIEDGTFMQENIKDGAGNIIEKRLISYDEARNKAVKSWVSTKAGGATLSKMSGSDLRSLSEQTWKMGNGSYTALVANARTVTSKQMSNASPDTQVQISHLQNQTGASFYKATVPGQTNATQQGGITNAQSQTGVEDIANSIFTPTGQTKTQDQQAINNAKLKAAIDLPESIPQVGQSIYRNSDGSFNADLAQALTEATNTYNGTRTSNEPKVKVEPRSTMPRQAQAPDVSASSTPSPSSGIEPTASYTGASQQSSHAAGSSTVVVDHSQATTRQAQAPDVSASSTPSPSSVTTPATPLNVEPPMVTTATRQASNTSVPSIKYKPNGDIDVRAAARHFKQNGSSRFQ